MTTTVYSGQSAALEVDSERSQSVTSTSAAAKRQATSVRTWVGRVMSGLVIAFLLLASAFPKLFLPGIAVESMHQLGWSEKYLLLIAIIEVAGTVLYAIPRTASLGAVLLTGLLGGAVASQLRIDAPTFSHTLFPIYVGLLMWGGLGLRSAQLRDVLPLTTRD
jgi:hypothetical protein